MIACGALAADVRRIGRRRGWDLDVHPVPALLHNRPERIAPTVAAAVAQLRRDTTRSRWPTETAVPTARSTSGLDRLAAEHCYDMFAREEVAEALAEQPGTYFLTDFLARTFERTVVRELGLDRHPELRDQYFAHYTRVLWLAQRPADATHWPPSAPPPGSGCRSRFGEVGDAGLERQLEALVVRAYRAGRPVTASARPG